MSKERRLRYLFVFLLASYAFPKPSGAQSTRPYQSILIETHKPYDAVVAAIQSRGGSVTKQFKYVDAIAADVPVDTLSVIRTMVGAAKVTKDEDVAIPTAMPAGPDHPLKGNLSNGPVATGDSNSWSAVQTTSGPATPVSLNNAGTNIEKLHSLGLTGAGVIVAVIDSGIRPGLPLLDSDNSVIGGEDFVGDGKGFLNPANDGHGSFVAGLISGNAEFKVSGPLLDAIRAYAPNALNASGRLPLIGTAPASKIYALRYFGPNKGGAKISTVLAAVERVIQLRRDYENHVPGGLKIEVCNMSFGVSSTVYAGHTLLEQAVDRLYENGIVGVAAAGDAGPSSLTIASPSTAFNGLSVGGYNAAANDRIIRDLTIGPGAGLLYRPFSGTESYVFSSRGPTADGRVLPRVVASAVGNFGQGFCPSQTADACSKTISIAGGTSFSAPIVAGIAAVLRQAFPNATAHQIRNAIVATARVQDGGTFLINDGSTELDHGAGVPDAFAAYSLLLANGAPDGPPIIPVPNILVATNVESNTNLDVHASPFSTHVGPLKPGQRAEVLINVPKGTGKLIVDVNHIISSLPPSGQNQVFGDGIFVDVHGARTSVAPGQYLADTLPRVNETSHLELSNLDTGIVRITISGDYVNAGEVSADVAVSSVPEALSTVTASGPIGPGDHVIVPIQIPNHVRVAEFRLSWTHDWSHYPTTDLDMTLFAPGGAAPNLAGATLASPERAILTNPTPGLWQVDVFGFSVPAGADSFELRVLFDGVAVH